MAYLLKSKEEADVFQSDHCSVLQTVLGAGLSIPLLVKYSRLFRSSSAQSAPLLFVDGSANGP